MLNQRKYSQNGTIDHHYDSYQPVMIDTVFNNRSQSMLMDYEKDSKYYTTNKKLSRSKMAIYQSFETRL